MRPAAAFLKRELAVLSKVKARLRWVFICLPQWGQFITPHFYYASSPKGR